MKVPIFNMGSPVQRQCAQRADGVWFIRCRRVNRPGWSKWMQSDYSQRPIAAWYDPRAGKARLPK